MRSQSLTKFLIRLIVERYASILLNFPDFFGSQCFFTQFPDLYE